MEAMAMFSKGEVVCTVCGKLGHVKEKCWFVVGYPPWHPNHEKDYKEGRDAQRGKWKEQNNYKNQKWKKGGKGGKPTGKLAANVQGKNENTAQNLATITPQQLEQLMRLLPTPSKTGGSETDEEMDCSYAGMVSCCFANTRSCEWIIDSGASDHITGTFECLIEPERSKKEPKLNLPTGDTSLITHCGKVMLANNLKLENVLFVPSFKHNLLSVQKLIKDTGCKVEFHKSYCVILDPDNSKIKGIGKAVSGLYYLVNAEMSKIMKMMNTSNVKAMSASSSLQMPDIISDAPKSSNTILWHQRLGHAPLAKLKKIEQLKGLDEHNTDICLTCPMAKFTKLPYQLSESRAAEVFDLVHIDIWGPYKVNTRGNHRYFLTMVDDHSRVSWIHLLKLKSEAYNAIQKFVNMAKTQFNKAVKTIRSNNALEFDDKQCRPFFENLGITHQTSCVDRPQQNGRAERKHRNILEMSRALRFQSGLPLQFWGDCALTAVHLINRLPIPILCNKSPYEVLFKTAPKYNHLKTFGCLAMASNPS